MIRVLTPFSKGHGDSRQTNQPQNVPDMFLFFFLKTDQHGNTKRSKGGLRASEISGLRVEVALLHSSAPGSWAHGHVASNRLGLSVAGVNAVASWGGPVASA